MKAETLKKANELAAKIKQLKAQAYILACWINSAKKGHEIPTQDINVNIAEKGQPSDYVRARVEVSRQQFTFLLQLDHQAKELEIETAEAELAALQDEPETTVSEIEYEEN